MKNPLFLLVALDALPNQELFLRSELLEASV